MSKYLQVAYYLKKMLYTKTIFVLIMEQSEKKKSLVLLRYCSFGQLGGFFGSKHFLLFVYEFRIPSK